MELITKIICLTATIIVITIEGTTAQQQQQQQQYVGNNILDIEPPKFYILNPSPLRNRESLRQEQYFNFLNTLYRNDRSKSHLFENRPEGTLQNLHRQRRAADDHHVVAAAAAPAVAVAAAATPNQIRPKRAIVFRPLFVYRQEEIKKQRIAEEKRRKYRH